MTFLPRFENMLNWGNIITLAVMGGGGLIAFTTMQSEVRYFKEAVVQIQDDQSDYEVRLRAVEFGFGRVEERLIAINAALQELVRLNSQKGAGE